jgi:hypothetical protein
VADLSQQAPVVDAQQRASVQSQVAASKSTDYIPSDKEEKLMAVQEYLSNVQALAVSTDDMTEFA